MKIVLSGGTGFIGQAAVAAIRRRGWQLSVLVRNQESPGSKWIAQQGGQLVPGDVTSAFGLEQALAGASS